MKKKIFLFFTLIFISTAFAEKRGCGTSLWINQHNHLREKPTAKTVLTKTTSCKAEAYYQSVLELISEHFHIYYTLEGPHAATQDFIDTLAYYLEDAYSFYVNQLKMKEPLGISTTYHYQKSNHGNRYPIEVLDLDLVRNVQYLLGSPCYGCFGLTFPYENNSYEKTTVLFDNDFRYTASNAPKGTLENGCTYSQAVNELYNTAGKYSYNDRPKDGIRITAYHELYHAVQARYYDFSSYYTFWLEASAAGMEELKAPDVNDYLSYLIYLNSIPGMPLDQTYSDYSLSILFLFLYQQYGISFDASLWENYSKAQEKPFEEILAETIQKKQQSPDSIFHLFAEQLFFTGERVSLLNTSKTIYTDAALWPTINSRSLTDSLILSYPAFNYYSLNGTEFPDFDSFQGKASVALWSSKAKSAKFISLDSVTNIAEILKEINMSDSSVLILSRLSEIASEISVQEDSLPLRSYPNPWKGTGELCFSPLPENKKFIEIRTRIGKLVIREPYQGSVHCMDSKTIRKHLAPGLYRFRAGSSGKTIPFLVIY